jgi:hypothetical protein
LGYRCFPMAEPTVIYDDVVVLRNDGLGVLCRIHGRQLFIGSMLILPGSTARIPAISARLVLPEWFAIECGLPLPTTP